MATRRKGHGHLQYVKNEKREPTFYARIPKMAIMDLDPYELALYCNYKQTAAEDGECTKSNETLAKETGMSVSKVKTTRAKLEKKGYIVVAQHFDDHGIENKPKTVKIVDVWEENHKRYYTPRHDVTTPQSPENGEGVTTSPQRRTIEEEPYKNDSASSDAELDISEKPKRVIKRSPIFITLARESFGIFNVDELDKAGVIRINILERWLKNNSAGATDQTLMAFYKWYDKTKKIARPKGESTFAENFTEFKQQALAEAAKRNTPEAQVLNAREDRNRAKAEEQRRAMEGVA
jgi:hypothetical protein